MTPEERAKRGIDRLYLAAIKKGGEMEEAEREAALVQLGRDIEAGVAHDSDILETMKPEVDNERPTT